MARPPQGRLPGQDSPSEDLSAHELPLDLPPAEPRRSRRLFGAPLDGRIEPRFNPAQLSETQPLLTPDKVAGDVTPPVNLGVTPPPSLGSIAGADIARDPFSYFSAPRVKDGRAEPSADQDPPPVAPSVPSVEEASKLPDVPMVSGEDRADVAAARSVPERLIFGQSAGERLAARRMDTEALLRSRRERPVATPSLGQPLPSEIRVTRNAPDAPLAMRDDRDAQRRLALSERAEPRFDSASDEAMTQIDPSVPPLIASRPTGDMVSYRDDVRLSPPLNVDWELGHAMDPMDVVTARSRHRAMDDTERLNARRNEAIIDQARNAVSSFGMNVDEVRVARAEARFKPKVPTVEDLIAQSRVDAIEEEQALIAQEEAMHDAPLVARRYEIKAPRFLKEGLVQRLRLWPFARAPRAPKVQRVKRHKQQSRLYEDIVAWIVVPPFIIGMIYGILELSKFIANSPIGKMLSGQ